MQKLPNNKKLLELLETHTRQQIADMYGVSRQAISYRLKNLGGSEFQQSLQRKKFVARAMYREGISVEIIAQRVKRSRNTIWRWCANEPRKNKWKKPTLKNLGNA